MPTFDWHLPALKTKSHIIMIVRWLVNKVQHVVLVVHIPIAEKLSDPQLIINCHNLLELALSDNKIMLSWYIVALKISQ